VAHSWCGPVVFRRYSLPANNFSSGDFTVGNPGGQSPAAQVWVLSGIGQNHCFFVGAYSIPGDLRVLTRALHPSLALLRPPAVIGAPGHLQPG
jgi:hypothetical protein